MTTREQVKTTIEGASVRGGEMNITSRSGGNHGGSTRVTSYLIGYHRSRDGTNTGHERHGAGYEVKQTWSLGADRPLRG